MSRITSEEHSKIGDGQNRHSYDYSDGSSRTVDERSDGGYTITDTDSRGNSVSGDGVCGPCGGYSRINSDD